MHQRKLIRHAVTAALVGSTAAGARVQATRVEPRRPSEIPAIGVYTATEETDPDDVSTAPRELLRQLKLDVVGWVLDSSAVPVDDAMDDLAEQIEIAMELDPYFGSTVSESILVATDMQVIAEDGNDPMIGVVRLTYSVTYRTSPVVGALDDFLRAGVTTRIVGADADNAVSDLVELQPAP